MMSEWEATREFNAVYARVREGVEIVIEENHRQVAMLKAAEPPRRKISECINAAGRFHSDYRCRLRRRRGSSDRLPSRTTGAAGLGLILDSSAAPL